MAWLYDPIAPTEAQAVAVLAILAADFRVPPAELRRMTGRKVQALYMRERDKDGKIVIPEGRNDGERPVRSMRQLWALQCRKLRIPPWLESKIWTDKTAAAEAEAKKGA